MSMPETGRDWCPQLQIVQPRHLVGWSVGDAVAWLAVSRVGETGLAGAADRDGVRQS